jgi:hypothetical protein
VCYLNFLFAIFQLENRNNSFQLLGTDVDIDANLNPWVIESNVNPTLTSKVRNKNIIFGKKIFQVAFERKDKTSMLNSMFTMIGYGQYNLEKIRSEMKLE